MNGLQRRMAGALLVVGGLAGLAGPAQAAGKVDDSRITFPVFAAGIDNPCTPEYDDITVSGTGRAFSKVWVAEDGSSRARTHLGIHLSGEAADGTGYVGADHFDAHTRIEDGVAYITADSRTRLTSQGADPNFALRLKVRVSFALDGSSSSYEVVKDQTDCRG
jgi:hypothetical protein